MSRVVAAFYVVLQPEPSWSGDRIDGIHADRIRQGKPKVEPGEVAVKVRLVFDAEALMETVPVVTQEVQPADFMQQAVPEIAVGDG